MKMQYGKAVRILALALVILVVVSVVACQMNKAGEKPSQNPSAQPSATQPDGSTAAPSPSGEEPTETQGVPTPTPTLPPIASSTSGPAPTAPVTQTITDTKVEINTAWAVHDWTNKTSGDIDSAVTQAKGLETPCVVKLSSNLSKADVKKLQKAAPNVLFDYSFTKTTLS